uniref:K+ potassium transporter integral membrane domain-containing protein n=1 Tax=Aegilops tauschii subsp. strangulata TaxID=200361 RepID=A0A453BQN4_AEGTS
QQQGGDDEVLEVECALDMPEVVQRQDSLYRDASRAGGASHHGHERWGKTLRLAFQCVGVLYGDIGTSPLYVYSSTFTAGVRHTDDLLGVLSLIIYSFILFTMVKYVYIALRANDDGDGGTFALYSLISRHAKVSLVPNQQAEDELGHAAAGLPGGVPRAAGQGAPGDEQARAHLALPAHHPRHGHGDQRRLPDAGHLRAVRRRGAQGEGATPHHRPDRVDHGGHPGGALLGAALRHGQGGLLLRAGRHPLAAPHRRRRRVQPRQARHRRPPGLQPQVYRRLLPAQQEGRVDLPRRHPPLLHRHRGSLRRPRLLQHPLHPAQLRLRPRPLRAPRLRRPGRLPPQVPGRGGQHVLQVHPDGPLLAHLRPGHRRLHHRQPGHDLLRLRHHLPLAGAGVLPARQDPAHLQAVPGPALHPGGQLPAGLRRLRRHRGLQDHRGHRRGARHLRRPRHAHHYAAPHRGDAPGVEDERVVRRSLLRRLHGVRVRLPLLGALQVPARRVHPRGHLGGAHGRHDRVALRAREALQVRTGAHGVAGQGAGAAGRPRPAQGARSGALLHGPRAGDPAGVPAPHREDPVHPRRAALRLRQAPPRAARGHVGAVPVPAGGAEGAQAVPVRGEVRVP